MYAADLEGTLHYADPTVAIDWPVPGDAEVHISDKDCNAKRLSEFQSPFHFDPAESAAR
jgi:dTDP-4-dehydrorhamnose 3,5-epimerase